MTREEADFIGALNRCYEISNEAYKKIMCHCEEQEPCEDAISRRLLLQVMFDYCGYDLNALIQIKDIPDLINGLPSVQPKQKTGRWIDDKLGHTVCSECYGIRRDSRLDYIAYCNKCGAKMEEEE